MKNGASKYDAQYACMGEGPDLKRAKTIFNAMADYIEFYESWIYTCAALNRSSVNPNRELTGRWNRRKRR